MKINKKKIKIKQQSEKMKKPENKKKKNIIKKIRNHRAKMFFENFESTTEYYADNRIMFIEGGILLIF